MAKSDIYLKRFQTFTKKRTSPEDYVKRYSSELGVDDLRGRVASARGTIRSTEDTIRAVPEGVSGRTSGSLVTDAQRNRLVQNEVAPLNEALRTQSQDYGAAREDLGDTLTQLDQRTQYALAGDETKANSILALLEAATNKEQFNKTQRMELKKLKVSVREAAKDRAAAERNARISAAASAAAGFSPSFGGDGSSKTKPMATRKQDGGYAFTGSKGQDISAATYARITNRDIRDVLYSMGQSGDKYAAQVYNQLRADPFFGKGDKAYDKRVKTLYSPIFWGE